MHPHVTRFTFTFKITGNTPTLLWASESNPYNITWTEGETTKSAKNNLKEKLQTELLYVINLTPNAKEIQLKLESYR